MRQKIFGSRTGSIETIRVTWIAVGTVLVMLGACSRSPGDVQTVAGEIDALFEPFTVGIQPGVAVAVIHNGKTVFEGAYGYADLDGSVPIGSDTAFRLASVSKQFAAMAIMMLAENGSVSLDDAVGRYVPELAGYEGVTIRHLLLHTGGLPDYYDLIDTSAGMPTNQDAAELLGKLSRADFPPGDRFEYSNPGYDMLGPIVAAASGMTFASYLESRIFARLGMSHTLVYDDRLPDVRNRAYGYVPADGGFGPDDYDPLNAIIGSGGIYSTLNDLAKWDRALYGDELVSTAMLELAFAPGTNNAGESTGYGFGWRVEEYLGHKCLRHGGSWVGFRTHIARIPERHLTVILLSNRGDVDPEPYVDRILGIYLGQPRVQ